jgi:hypothetical protein
MTEKELREHIKSQIGDLINEGRKTRQETPNEFWYLEFKKWAYKKRGKIKKELIEIKNTNRPGGSTGQMFQRMEAYWLEWANKNNKDANFIDDINTGGKFGRALVLMMIDDNLVFKMDGNRMTGIIGESKVNEKREDVGKYNTVKKVIAKLGRRPSEQDLATFINNNYYDVTEVERGEKDPAADDKIADLVGFYKFDIDDWLIAWEDAQNESVVTEAFQKDGHVYNHEEVGDKKDNALAGKDGILGSEGVFISWEDVRMLQRKYRGRQ